MNAQKGLYEFPGEAFILTIPIDDLYARGNATTASCLITSLELTYLLGIISTLAISKGMGVIQFPSLVKKNKVSTF